MSTAPLSIYSFVDYILPFGQTDVNSIPKPVNKLCIQCQNSEKNQEILVAFDDNLRGVFQKMAEVNVTKLPETAGFPGPAIAQRPILWYTEKNSTAF